MLASKVHRRTVCGTDFMPRNRELSVGVAEIVKVNRNEDTVDLVSLYKTKMLHLILSVGLVSLESHMSTLYRFRRCVRFIVM